MDQKKEFSKWISAVEEALSTEFIVATAPEQHDCGCGSWNCDKCFPDQYSDQVVDGEFGGDIHTTPADKETDAELELGMNDVEFDMQELEEVGMMDEEEENFVEKGRAGKGVKLGDIVQKTEFRKTGGENSPMTYGEENLDEEEVDIDLDEPAGGVDFDPTDAGDNQDLISAILFMQDNGLSNASRQYSPEELSSLSMKPDALQKIYTEVTGSVDEATKPTKTKTSYDPFADIDDILGSQDDNLPANIDAPQGFPDDDIDDEVPPMDLPTASRDQTRNSLRGMTPSDTMRDFMNRINPDAGAGEPELPDTPENEVVVRTAQDVPAVISHAMRTTGFVTPVWHNISNLPGYSNRNIRGMGRNVFGMFTSTPLEHIRTIANVGGQGPNTSNEVNSVAAWLRDNAEDLGDVQLDHGMAIPGYSPDVKEYRINGVRFHVVRDPMGQYIYAYPDADARLGGQNGQEQGQLGGRGNMPRLRENKEFAAFLKPTLFERIQWDEEILSALKEATIEETELAESSLSKLIGKQRGGQKLVQWLHRKHKLSNEAELEPVPFNKELLWTQFKSHPDDFVIVSGSNGVAGIKPSEKHIEAMKAEKARKGQTYNPARDATLPYQIIAFTDDGEQVDPALLRPRADAGDEEPETRDPDPTVMKARMGKSIGKDLQNENNTFRLLADQIGTLKTVWISGWAGYRGDPESIKPSVGSVEREKMAKRADMKKVTPIPEMEAVNQIFKRVRPVLKTLGAQAVSLINRRAQKYFNAGNFDGAQKLAAAGKKLQEFMATVDTSGDINLNTAPPAFTRQLLKAIADAAGSARGSDEYNDFLQDVAKGNATKLKPVLDALRDNLVALA